jgi:hypothetical protein
MRGITLSLYAYSRMKDGAMLYEPDRSGKEKYQPRALFGAMARLCRM